MCWLHYRHGTRFAVLKNGGRAHSIADLERVSQGGTKVFSSRTGIGLADFVEELERSGVPYTITASPGEGYVLVGRPLSAAPEDGT